jgi:hypothetical protein
MPLIEVVGAASGTSRFLAFDEEHKNQNFLNWLRGQGITIASSCDGEGVCKKCGIQNGWLTCEMTLEEFLKREPSGKVLITYL